MADAHRSDTPSPATPRVVVIGAGLLGGSLIAALQARRFSSDQPLHLTAVSSASTLAVLRTHAWCDAVFAYDATAEACAGADLLLLCTPLSTIDAQLQAIGRIRERLAPDAIVTDVGSTKGAICRVGFAAFPDDEPRSPRFVGGHPMAGSEKSGIEASDPLLYQSALWVLCPPPDLPSSRLQALQALIRSVGARVALLDPAQHDAAVARISHVPQIVASALADWAGSDAALAETSLALAAGGFRDMTRLALSSWEIWRDIVATNNAPIADGLAALAVTFNHLADAARMWPQPSTGTAGIDGQPVTDQTSDPASEFGRTFAGGKAFRQRFRMPRKGIVHDLTEFVVRLSDRPGELLSLFTPLANAQINVQDLEILKVREGESGTILLGFATPEDASRARELLSREGFLIDER